MALKIYLENNVLYAESPTEKTPFNPGLSSYVILNGTFTVMQSVGNTTARRSSPVNELQDGDSNPIGNEEAVHTYMSTRINFKSGSGGSDPSDPINYRADNYTGILAVATNPELNQLAYARNSEGTRWLPGSVGGTYKPAGLYWYDGTNWVSDREAIAEQLQINIDDIDQLEVDVAQNDADIIALNSALTAEIANRIAGDNNLDSSKLDKGAITGNIVSGMPAAPVVNETLTDISISADKKTVTYNSEQSTQQFELAVYLDTINGDLLPVFVDTNRGGRVLSVETFSVTMGENAIGNNDWFIVAGNASDQDSCFIAKRDLLITAAWYNCEDANNIAKPLNLFIGNANAPGAAAETLFTTIANNNTYQDGTRDDLLIEVAKGDRIRFRGGPTGGTIADTVLNVSGHYEKR